MINSKIMIEEIDIEKLCECVVNTKKITDTKIISYIMQNIQTLCSLLIDIKTVIHHINIRTLQKKNKIIDADKVDITFTFFSSYNRIKECMDKALGIIDNYRNKECNNCIRQLLNFIQINFDDIEYVDGAKTFFYFMNMIDTRITQTKLYHHILHINKILKKDIEKIIFDNDCVILDVSNIDTQLSMYIGSHNLFYYMVNISDIPQYISNNNYDKYDNYETKEDPIHNLFDILYYISESIKL